VIPQWDAVDLEIGAVLAHANCWRKFAISCNSSGLKFAALHSPLLALSGHLDRAERCLLLGVKRTFF
jgi:hypothetical protein